MDKKALLEALCQQLEQDKAVLIEAAQATYDAATNEESKAENEYDTRGLEASYLAGAQAKRVAEIEELLVICKHLVLKHYGPEDKINSTALIEVAQGKRTICFFMLPKGGGVHFRYGGKEIQVITPNSPLGEALQDLTQGDIASVENGNQVREYEILQVW